MAYAEGTTVSVERSFAEIVTLLRKAGADEVAQAQSSAMFSIQFALADRVVRFRLSLPLAVDMPERDGRGSFVPVDKRVGKAQQAARARARAMLLVVKAKLESVESGIETFEQAFLANVVMADGSTVHERISSGLALEYKTRTPNVMMLERPKT